MYNAEDLAPLVFNYEMKLLSNITTVPAFPVLWIDEGADINSVSNFRQCRSVLIYDYDNAIWKNDYVTVKCCFDCSNEFLRYISEIDQIVLSCEYYHG